MDSDKDLHSLLGRIDAVFEYPEPSPTTNPNNFCDYCLHRPKFGNYKYCGRTCGKRAAAFSQIPSLCKRCQLKPRSKNSDFCTKTCLEAWQTNSAIGAGKHDAANRPVRKRTHLNLLDVEDPAYVHVKGLFEEGWLHPNKPRPFVHSIFEIRLTRALMEPYHDYFNAVQNAVGPWNPEAVQRLLFHGTVRGCVLGETPTRNLPCHSPKCSLCCITKNSFDVSKSGSSNSFSRFGAGIYTTSCSSKADDYTSNMRDELQLHALLVSGVVVGKAHKMTRTSKNLVCPPRGTHSVLGVPGEDLNYEETVVYTNDAIRPLYLITYGHAPKPKEQSPAKISPTFSLMDDDEETVISTSPTIRPLSSATDGIAPQSNRLKKWGSMKSLFNTPLVDDPSKTAVDMNKTFRPLSSASYGSASRQKKFEKLRSLKSLFNTPIVEDSRETIYADKAIRTLPLAANGNAAASKLKKRSLIETLFNMPLV